MESAKVCATTQNRWRLALIKKYGHQRLQCALGPDYHFVTDEVLPTDDSVDAFADFYNRFCHKYLPALSSCPAS